MNKCLEKIDKARETMTINATGVLVKIKEIQTITIEMETMIDLVHVKLIMTKKEIVSKAIKKKKTV
jgi:hypothetical protein